MLFQTKTKIKQKKLKLKPSKRSEEQKEQIIKSVEYIPIYIFGEIHLHIL